MAHIRSFQHVGITVEDIDGVAAFFTRLGLEVEGRTYVEGDFIDAVCGIPGSHTEVVMLRPPGGGVGIELGRFLRPASTPGSPEAMATELGIRNVCFQVEDLPGLVEELAADGYGLVGEIGNHENAWLMAYVRGPEGIVVALAEQVG